MRIGQGFDVHQLVEGRKLVVGGVEIPHDKGLLGHSDADCLTHAIADALLGAAGLPDIGHFFPPSDNRFKGIDSQEILAHVRELVDKRSFAIVNVDSSVIAEAPKILPYREDMRERLAKTLGIKKRRVNIKATTNEGLGAIGAGEGICAHAVCLLQKY